jgi:Ca2+-binding RTX toxin-like protein
MVFDGSDESDGLFKVFGGAANDALTGGGQSDILMGAFGADTLSGGAGNDIFRYDFQAESTSASRDEIEDFEAGDKVDLSRMDANSNLAGNQAFTFIGDSVFGNVAGQLRFENAGGDNWLVQGDTNGDSVSDFEILLVIANPLHVINSDDFVL